jgi:dTDP-glucose 4,6-dehydratase
MAILVTGGCGFIGSNYINALLRTKLFNGVAFDYVINIDKLDYCSAEDNVIESSDAKYIFVKGSVCDKELLRTLFDTYAIEYIVHFAAQTHVDNSFDNSIDYTTDNILGTHQLLECCRLYGKGNIKRFIHMSTDEVYGELSTIHCKDSDETALLNPTNPYAATKAGAEFIVRSYYYSYNIPIVIIRCNNVYGERQYPEKIIPKFITLLKENKKLTIHGTGLTRRNFIYIDDVVRAIDIIAAEGIDNNVYNIGSTDEYNVIEIATLLLHLMKGRNSGDSGNGGDEKIEDWVEYTKDRNFNDFRYAIDTTKLNAIGWKKSVPFHEGIQKTVEWYCKKMK